MFTLQLVNTITDALIDDDVVEGESIDIGALGANDISILATPSAPIPDVKSVKFQVDGPVSLTKTENSAPYALFGDQSGDFKGGGGAGLPAGDYTVTITAYDEKKAGGDVIGTPTTVSFTIGESSGPGPDPADAAEFAFSQADVQALIDANDPSDGVGRAQLVITSSNNVQKSNFAPNSFQIDNIGDKRIVGLYLDVSDAIFPDANFDPDGRGGDDVARELNYGEQLGDASPIDPNGSNPYGYLFQSARPAGYDSDDPFDPNALDDVDNLFVDETANNNLIGDQAAGGFRGALVLYEALGSGASSEFAIDMDPNSVAGIKKNTLNRDSNTAGRVDANGDPIDFDIGGVSGAELIGSKVTVLFGDGTMATGVLAPNGTQAGAIAIIDETVDLEDVGAPALTVNGVSPGGAGQYGGDRPTITVQGEPGDVVRVTMVKALDPTGAQNTVAGGQITIDQLVAARLAAQYPDFPVNNAVEWQFIDVTISAGGVVDITDGFGGASFDYNEIADAIDGADDFPGDDILPLGFVANVIDNKGKPLSDVSEPIYLLSNGTPVGADAPVNFAPEFLSADEVSVEENEDGTAHTLSADDLNGDDLTYSIEGGADAALFDIDPDTGALSFRDAPDFEAPSDDDGDNVYALQVGVSDGVAPVVTQDLEITVTDDPNEDVPPPSQGDGYYQGVSKGNKFYFKIQFEDPNGPIPAGAAAPGEWKVLTEAEPGDGSQAGFQGDGYIQFADESSNAIGGVAKKNILLYTIYVPEGETGEYQLITRTSNDGEFENDEQNDYWVKLTNEAGELINIGRPSAHPISQDHVKHYGAGKNGKWGEAIRIDGGGKALADIPEPGFYTFSFAGRSDGLNLDFFRFFRTNAADPGQSAEDSSFVDLSGGPTLTLSINDNAISENGGAATATVTRNTEDLSDALVVTLSSSDESEATVPDQVVIPAGQVSVDFAVAAEDDAFADGTQTPTITASAAGFDAATVTLDVADDEDPELTLTIDAAAISETGGAATATVTRNTEDLSDALVVTLSSSDESEATVPNQVVIPAGQVSVDFPVTAEDDAFADGTQTPTITASAAGFDAATATLDIADDEDPELTLTIDPAAISETGGAATATVSRNTEDLSDALVVTLSSSDESEATVPNQVVIPAGQVSVDFAVTAEDDAFADGTQTPTITASATGFDAATATLDIADDEDPELSLTIDPAAISETGGAATATVTRNTEDLSDALVVTLSSSDESEATVPNQVVIPAGEVSVDFTVTAEDDAFADGTQTPTITASATGFDAATATLDVADDEAPELTLTIDAATISENGGAATATVSRNTEDLSDALTVKLLSSDISEARAPIEVVIPAGQAAVDFAVAAEDDLLADGTRTLALSASAAGFVDGVASLDVTDDENGPPLFPAGLLFDASTSAETDMKAFAFPSGPTAGAPVFAVNPGAAPDSVTLRFSAAADAPARIVILSGDDFASAGEGMDETPTGGTVTAYEILEETAAPGGGAFAPVTAITGLSWSLLDVLAAVETLTNADDQALLDAALAGSDAILGGPGADALLGLDGADTISGGDGADAIKGGDDDDLLLGLDGDDELLGGAGADTIMGGLGDDTIKGGADADELSGGAGNDEILGGGGADRIKGGSGADVIEGGAGDDVIDGKADDDWISGAAGEDAIDGGSGADTLKGGLGDDALSGDAGDDTLKGGADADTLKGGADSDLLIGGGGEDVFMFDFGDGSDVIADFQDGVDKISFADIPAADLAYEDLSIEASGAGAMVTYGLGDQILVENVAPDDLDADDFLFGS